MIPDHGPHPNDLNDRGTDPDSAARVTTLRLELPETVMAQLRLSARRRGRSPAAEAVALLQEAVAATASGSVWTPIKQSRLVKSAGLHVELSEELAAQLRGMAEKAHRSVGAQAAHLLQEMLQRQG